MFITMPGALCGVSVCVVDACALRLDMLNQLGQWHVPHVTHDPIPQRPRMPTHCLLRALDGLREGEKRQREVDEAVFMRRELFFLQHLQAIPDGSTQGQGGCSRQRTAGGRVASRW